MWYKLFSHITLDTDAPFSSPQLSLLLSQGAVGLLTQMRPGVWSQWGAFILLLLFKTLLNMILIWGQAKKSNTHPVLGWFSGSERLVLFSPSRTRRAISFKLSCGSRICWKKPSVYILVYCTFTGMFVYRVCLGSGLRVNWRKSQRCCSWEYLKCFLTRSDKSLKCPSFLSFFWEWKFWANQNVFHFLYAFDLLFLL